MPRFTEEAAFRTSTPWAQSFTQEPERACTGRGQNATINTASLPVLRPAWEGLETNLYPESSCLPGPRAVSWPRQRDPRQISTGTERCLSPAATGEQPWKAAGRPTLVGRAAPPHCSRPGGAAACWKPGKHSQTQPVSTNVTAARPHSPAQTSGSSTPFSAWLARPELAVGTALGFLIQVGHSSTWPREHRVCL